MSPTIEELKWANRMYLGGHKEMKDLCVRFKMSHNQMRDAWDELGMKSYRYLLPPKRKQKETKALVIVPDPPPKPEPPKPRKRGGYPPITDDEKATVIKMKRLGHTNRYISRKMKRGHSVVWKIWHEHLIKETRG